MFMIYWIERRLILRRRPQQDVLQGLLDEINAIVSVDNCLSETCEPINLKDGNDEIEGHKEHSLTQNSKTEDLIQIQVTQDQMEHAFPRLCSELRFARDQLHCDRLMDQLADHIQLGETWYAMKSSHGPAMRFMVLGYILQRAESIQNHRAYLSSLLSKIEQENTGADHAVEAAQNRAGWVVILRMLSVPLHTFVRAGRLFGSTTERINNHLNSHLDHTRKL